MTRWHQQKECRQWGMLLRPASDIIIFQIAECYMHVGLFMEPIQGPTLPQPVQDIGSAHKVMPSGNRALHTSGWGLALKRIQDAVIAADSIRSAQAGGHATADAQLKVEPPHMHPALLHAGQGACIIRKRMTPAKQAAADSLNPFKIPDRPLQAFELDTAQMDARAEKCSSKG